MSTRGAGAQSVGADLRVRPRSEGKPRAAGRRIGLSVALLVSLVASSASPADAPPFPSGTSSQTLEGLRCSIVMPDPFDLSKEHSLVVVLHGNGGTETGMAGSLAHLADEDFVVCAPKSTGLGWEGPGDIDAVKRIAADLKKRLRVGERRMHAVGFSNGGWNLAPIAFDETLRFQSACWVASGFKGGKAPKHAKKEMSVLALAGSDDGNRRAAEETPKLLGEKVRTAECRLQPGLGHAWPEKLVPYFSWWIGVAEGRFKPGRCAAFEWKDSIAAALEAAGSAKTGAFAYWYSSAQDADPAAKTVENDVARDALVQRFGRQLAAVKLELEADSAGAAKAGVKSAPAFVVYDATGKVREVVQGKVDAKSLAAAFRAVAQDKSLPKD
jgi:predicted esterase